MARVTLQQAVDHLLLPIVLDSDPPDPRQADLALKLLAAEAIIIDYLQIPPPPDPVPTPVVRARIAALEDRLARLERAAARDDSGFTPWPPDPAAPVDPPTPPRVAPADDDPIVQAAILLQLGELWRFRGDDQSDQNAGQDAGADAGQLSPTITNLLRRYRDPALA